MEVLYSAARWMDGIILRVTLPGMLEKYIWSFSGDERKTIHEFFTHAPRFPKS